MRYRLLRRQSATDEYAYWGTYDISNPKELEAMLRAVYDFGRWLYHDFKVVKLEDSNE